MNRIKALLGDDAVFYTTVVLLVAIMSFGLGRWSSMEVGDNATPVVINTQPAALPLVIDTNVVKNDGSAVESTLETASEAQISAQTALSQKEYVGSKNSDKYHLPWCSGAKRIKEENKVWFATKKEAEEAGYVPAANCKGL